MNRCVGDRWRRCLSAVFAVLLRRPEVTHNHCVHDVDTYFPDLDADPAWEIARRGGVATIAAGEGDEGLDYEFVTYRRVEA